MGEKQIPPSFIEFSAGTEDVGRRIDRIVRKLLRAVSMSEIYRAFRKGAIKLNGKKIAPETAVTECDKIWIHRQLIQDYAKIIPHIPQPKDPGILPRITVFKNNDLLILNKPYGMPVHGGGAIHEEETADALVKQDYITSKRAESSLSFVPGPLHRLDRNTSGLIVFSQTLKGAAVFSKMMQERTVTKCYLGIVNGTPQKGLWKDKTTRDSAAKISIADPSGRDNVTEILPLAVNGNVSLVLFTIHTGRTHQIRVQCAIHHCPLLGDRKYGSTAPVPHYFLHAWKLEFPRGCELFSAADKLSEQPIFTAPLPSDFAEEITTQFGVELLASLDKHDL